MKTKWLGWTRRGIVRYIQSFDEEFLRRKWKKVILHHTYKPTVSNFNEKPDASYWLTAIDRVHRSKGWKKIAYHFIIMPDGLIYVGRELDEDGAHTVGHNHNSIGVCVFGDFNTETMPTSQYISTKYLIAFLLVALKLDHNSLFFHRNFALKTCPGSKLDLVQWREIVRLTLPSAQQIYDDIKKTKEGIKCLKGIGLRY